MGLDQNGIRFLFYGQSQHASFCRTATLGRQRLDISAQELKEIARQFNKPLSKQQLSDIFSLSGGFAEHLLRFLGAEHIVSFDHSQYEGASIAHDFNLPIPENYKQAFSLVLDGGSLEHIFNIPVAIKNLMEMIEPGGHYLGITPANNFFGHGFYQFSPEFYFNVFSEDNGFFDTEIIAFENRNKTQWYTVKKPAELKSRVTLRNSHPVYLLVWSKRKEVKCVFRNFPQQTDYLEAWNSHQVRSSAKFFNTSLWPITCQSCWQLRKYIPSSLKMRLTSLIRQLRPGFMSKFFSKKT